MNRAVRRMTAIVFMAFAVLVAGLTYDQVIAGPRYRDDPRNARLIIYESGRERGGIVTADGVVVAQSVAATSGRTFTRTYPEGGLYAHTVGVASALLEDRGLESTRGDVLTSQRDATITGLLSALAGEDLRPRGLRLSIDHRLQQTALNALAGQTGAVVALDPRTGAVLAMVSLPTFDPNSLVSANAVVNGEQLVADPSRPLVNRATSETYAPGSTFKVITAAAALESGIAAPETEFPNTPEVELPNSTAVIRNFGGDLCGASARVSLRSAFVRSCNTVFALLGMEVGGGELAGRAATFGFGDQIPFELTAAASSVAPDEVLADLAIVAQSAIGQRDVRATPLQMALAAAAVANGGLVMEPFIVAEVFDAEARVVAVADPTEWRRALTPSVARTLGEMMVQVVESGTGRAAAVPGSTVGGKTGTAEVPDQPPHAWFIGYGGPPGGEPTIAVAVLVESGGAAGNDATGGSVAAPIAHEVLEEWLTR